MYRHPCTVTFEEAVTRKRPIFYTDCYRFFFFFFLFDIRSHNTGNSDDLPYLDSIFYFQAFRDFFFHKLESHFSLLNFVDRNNIVKKISSKSICSRRRCSNRTYTDLPVPRFGGLGTPTTLDALRKNEPCKKRV